MKHLLAVTAIALPLTLSGCITIQAPQAVKQSAQPTATPTQEHVELTKSLGRKLCKKESSRIGVFPDTVSFGDPETTWSTDKSAVIVSVTGMDLDDDVKVDDMIWGYVCGVDPYDDTTFRVNFTALKGGYKEKKAVTNYNADGHYLGDLE